MTIEHALSEYKRIADGYVLPDGTVGWTKMNVNDRLRCDYYFALKASICSALSQNRLEIPESLFQTYLCHADKLR